MGATLSCGAWASYCGGFFCHGAWALGMRASVVVACGLHSCGSRALERRLSSCGARVFVAAFGISLVVASGGYSLLQYEGFSLWWLLLLQSMGSRHAGFSSCGTRAQ